jgi:hypothetical protein
MKDAYGNEMEVDVKKEGNKIIHTTVYTLEEGKITLRSEYKKFRGDEGCAYPERLCCNSGVGFSRCPFMKCVGVGNWRCCFEKK